MSLRRRIARTLRKKDEAARAPVPPIAVTLFEFARPMTDTMPVPRKLAHLKAAMALAQLAWNLPILERSGDPSLAREYRTKTEAELATKPAVARELVAQMMKSRLTRYGKDERLVTFVDVVEEGKDLRIVASDAHVSEGL